MKKRSLYVFIRKSKCADNLQHWFYFFFTKYLYSVIIDGENLEITARNEIENGSLAYIYSSIFKFRFFYQDFYNWGKYSC